MTDDRPVILVVDDVPDNIILLSNLLKNLYQIKISTNGEKAFEVAKASKPDLILLDVMMPVLDGYETCRRIKENEGLKDIPIIFLTAKDSKDDEKKGFDLGAADYMTKPVNAPVLLSRIKTHLDLKKTRDLLKRKTVCLEEEIYKRTKEINLLHEVSIMAMAALAETRDNETGMHLQRTKLYVKELAEYLSGVEKFKGVLGNETIELIAASAPLHDIGKVGIPDHILLKPSALTAEEFEIVKQHIRLGGDAITQAEQLMGNRGIFLSYAKEIVYFHHERWDGRGYLHGLKGEEIPLSARIMSVADVYDALVSKRVYKAAYSHEDAVQIILNESGKQFDPDIVHAFLACQEQFKKIHNENQDE